MGHGEQEKLAQAFEMTQLCCDAVASADQSRGLDNRAIQLDLKKATSPGLS
jgi:hypothetical protein